MTPTPTPFALSLVAVSAAFGQTEVDEESAPPIPAGKDGYTLFNPTPRELWRDLSADRPDATESPYTVDAGAVQIELSFVEYALEEDDGQTTHSFSVAPINLKLGLTNDLDIQLLFSPYEHVDAPGEDAEGVGDLGLRLKYNLWGNDSGDTALALLPFITFPTGADGITSDHVEGGLVVPFAMELAEGVGLGLQGELSFARNEQDTGYDTILAHTAVVGFDLGAGLGAYVEYIGEANTDTGHYSPLASGGLTYLLDADTQLDVGVIVGLDDPRTEDVRVFAGLTVRF